MSNVLVNKGDITVCWRKLTLHDKDEIKRLVLEAFVPRDPLCVSLNINSFSPAKQFLLSFVYSCLEENLSIGAYDQSDKDKLCGILMPKGYNLSQSNSNGENDTGKPDDMSMFVLRLMEEAQPYTEAETGEKKYLHVEVGTVDEKYCKMGIMTKLRKTAEVIAKEQQCRYLVAFSASKYTQNISEKLGYKTVKEFKYSEYVDKVTGTKPFAENMPAPHTSVKLAILDLELI